VKKQLEANKLRLVVTDGPESASVQESPAPPETTSQHDPIDATKCGSGNIIAPTTDLPSVDINDVEKLMTTVPLDDFFKALEAATPAQLQSLVGTLEKGSKSKDGSNLLMKLIDVPATGPRSIMSVVWWWECRRWLYNFCVGVIGLPFALLVWLLAYTVPSVAWALMAGVICYGIAANLCYSLGAPAELVARGCWKEKGEPYGPVLFTLGLIFSALLTIGLGAFTVFLTACGWVTF
jgi:hypothetical protein